MNYYRRELDGDNGRVNKKGYSCVNKLWAECCRIKLTEKDRMNKK